MINIFEEISFYLDNRDYKRQIEKKARGECSDCGFWVACPKCSERYSVMDKQIRKLEGRDELSDYFSVR